MPRMERDKLARVGEPDGRARVLPLVVLLLAIAVTVALAVWSASLHRAQDRALLERRTEAFGLALSSRVQAYVDTLPGLRQFGILRKSPTDAEFRQYVRAISLQQRFPGLALTFFAERVAAADRAAYLAAVRRDRSSDPRGHPDWNIQPAGDRPEYMVIRHMYPVDAISSGYDLYDPAQDYRTAVDRAIASGGNVATGPLLLARDRFSERQPELTSVVIRAPLYSGGVTPDTVDARHANALGVAGISFNTKKLVGSVLSRELSDEAHIGIVDLTSRRANQNAVVFDSDGPTRATSADEPSSDAVRFAIGVADRSWEIVVASRRTSPVTALHSDTWLVIGFGALLAASLTFMTRTLVNAKGLAESSVRSATAALQAERDSLEQSESRYRMLFENSEAALQNQARLTAILDSTPDFVGSADLQGRNLFLNLAWRRLRGLSEAVDVSALTVAECHPPWASAIILQQGMPEATRNGVWKGQTAVLAADGREIAVSQVILCHRDAKGEITHFSTVARDLTEQKRAETERRALELQLRESQKMESVGTLAGGVAHDFNNVLVAILGNTALAAEALDDSHPAQQNLARVKQAASRARTLVQQILTFSRRTTQQFSLQSLGPLVEEAVSLLRSTLPPTVALRSDIPVEPLFVLADPAQMQQVVMNLCTNAWQALPEGRGSIDVLLEAVYCAAGDALPHGLQPGPCARIRVKDDGTGMDALTRQRVFEPFFTTKRVGEGTGLGLAVVHGIVVGSSGAITVESKPGSGSCFDVYLPCHPGPTTGTAIMLDELARPSGHGEEILYVDDDEVVALTMQSLLERAGYRVTCRSNGTDALTELEAFPGRYALVISDFNMPDMSGLVVAQRVREREPALPVVITSGYVTDDLQERAKALGVKAVLLKEYSLERLGSLVHSILHP
ncbi:hypothetical protein BH11PSE8_BH11PSE8_37870 [soil metagenome]